MGCCVLSTDCFALSIDCCEHKSEGRAVSAGVQERSHGAIVARECARVGLKHGCEHRDPEGVEWRVTSY